MAKAITLKPLTNESLADLFLSMAMKEDNPQAGEKAYNDFYYRYKNYLYTIIKKACKSWEMYGNDLVEATFENTLLTVYAKAESFIVIERIPIENQERRMKAWLGKIANNEMLKLLRDSRTEKDKVEYIEDLTFFEDIYEDIEVPKSQDILLAERALNSLSERERDILVTYLMFQDGNKQLPRDEIQKLSDIWNVHSDNLRQIKKRAMSKLEMYMKTYKNH